jgi:hypothetical protein
MPTAITRSLSFPTANLSEYRGKALFDGRRRFCPWRLALIGGALSIEGAAQDGR